MSGVKSGPLKYHIEHVRAVGISISSSIYVESTSLWLIISYYFQTVSGTETYINSVILGSICIAPYIITGVLVNKVGKKNLYIACGLISVATTLGLRWASSKAGVVALFSFDVSITQMMKSLNQALVVELFPTTIRYHHPLLQNFGSK